MRLRLYDVRVSEFPLTNGICSTDIASVASLLNRCQRRLLYCKEVSEEGWYGTFAEVQFNGISVTQPYLTLPREFARVERLTVCRRQVVVNNQYVEYLTFGNGRMPRAHHGSEWVPLEGYTRNNVVTWTDLPAPPQIIRIYTTDPVDAGGRRVLIQGVDSNGNVVRTLDGPNQVMGEYVTVGSLFTDTNFAYTRITGLQKDVTHGTIQFFAVDPTTGAQTLIHTMEPGEQVADYRRYYLHHLPCNCRYPLGPQADVRVLAIVKLELIPVKVDQDYCLIQNLEALIEEAWSVHFGDLESTSSAAKALIHHKNAVKLLNGELTHYLGKDEAAIIFRPFGSARLEHIRINMI